MIELSENSVRLAMTETLLDNEKNLKKRLEERAVTALTKLHKAKLEVAEVEELLTSCDVNVIHLTHVLHNLKSREIKHDAQYRATIHV